MRSSLSWMAALLFAMFCAPSFADQKSELNQLRDRIENLQRDLAKSEESRSEVADALRTSEKAISEVNRGLLSLGREQGQISQSVADLKRKTDAGRIDVALIPQIIVSYRPQVIGQFVDQRHRRGDIESDN